MMYLLLRLGVTRPNLIALLLLILTLGLYLAYGVLVNDFFDRELDIAAGKFAAKRGHLNSKPELALTLILILVAIVALIIWINRGIVFDLLWLIAILMATAYSGPPMRLKTKGAVGFLTDSIIEKPLPILIVFAFFGYYGFEIFLFPVFGELIDSVFKHQVEEYELDAKSGVTSFAIQLGKDRSIRAEDKIVHPLNVLSVVSVMVICFFELPKISWVILLSITLIVIGLFVMLFLERHGRVRVGFPFPDPPIVGYLNFGFRTIFLAALAISILVDAQQYFPLAVLAFFSIGLYLKGLYKLFPDLARYLVTFRQRK